MFSKGDKWYVYPPLTPCVGLTNQASISNPARLSRYRR